MPGRDGTGPNGVGPQTGRGFGLCTGVGFYRRGMGLDINRRSFRDNIADSKELLVYEKGRLEKRIEIINEKLKQH